MNPIFKTKDKTGREIHLSKERWTHVTENHPEMSSTEKIEEIKATLIRPDFITPHKFDDAKRNYYKYYKDKKRYLLVIGSVEKVLREKLKSPEDHVILR